MTSQGHKQRERMGGSTLKGTRNVVVCVSWSTLEKKCTTLGLLQINAV